MNNCNISPWISSIKTRSSAQHYYYFRNGRMRTEYVERVTGIFEKERHSRNCHSTIAVLLSELVFTIYICLRGEKKSLIIKHSITQLLNKQIHINIYLYLWRDCNMIITFAMCNSDKSARANGKKT